MWTYYNLPFLLGEPDVRTPEIPSIDLDGRTLRGLSAELSSGIHTHCRTQQFYFDDERLLRRHDYQVDVAGGTPAAHFVSGYIEVRGLPLQRAGGSSCGTGTARWPRTERSCQWTCPTSS
jgi:hypothetical protein